MPPGWRGVVGTTSTQRVDPRWPKGKPNPITNARVVLRVLWSFRSIAAALRALSCEAGQRSKLEGSIGSRSLAGSATRSVLADGHSRVGRLSVGSLPPPTPRFLTRSPGDRRAVQLPRSSRNHAPRATRVSRFTLRQGRLTRWGERPWFARRKITHALENGWSPRQRNGATPSLVR
jgi:hypothetical protein